MESRPNDFGAADVWVGRLRPSDRLTDGMIRAFR